MSFSWMTDGKPSDGSQERLYLPCDAEIPYNPSMVFSPGSLNYLGHVDSERKLNGFGKIFSSDGSIITCGTFKDNELCNGYRMILDDEVGKKVKYEDGVELQEQ